MHAIDLAGLFIFLGAIFLAGLVTDLVGRHTPLPRVSLLILVGILVGPSGLDLLPHVQDEWYPLIADMALVMVGFLVGGSLTLKTLRQHGRLVILISATVVVVTLLVVLGGLYLLGVPLAAAILLAGIATATDPAATVDVIDELKADGPCTRSLLGIVAIDDAWGLIAFTLAMVVAGQITAELPVPALLADMVWELGGAVVLGFVLGIPMALLTGRISPGEPTQAEALGIVFLGGGLALWLEVSFLLTAMVLGAVVANVARHHQYAFHEIEGIEWPFMILFFVLSGAALDLAAIHVTGVAIVGFVLLRVLGRYLGGELGARLASPRPDGSRKLGLAMLPQAGVAMGMGLIAAQRFPEEADIILPVVIASIVVFEIVGPVMTRAVVRSWHEDRSDTESSH
jgi:Kef-type K+ transport system membrane component KefB